VWRGFGRYDGRTRVSSEIFHLRNAAQIQINRNTLRTVCYSACRLRPGVGCDVLLRHDLNQGAAQGCRKLLEGPHSHGRDDPYTSPEVSNNITTPDFSLSCLHFDTLRK
jgi:hypothetical protein